MAQELIRDLVAIIRRSTDERRSALVARLAGEPGAPPPEALDELVRRAMARHASDDELALALGALLALARNEREEPVSEP